MDLKIRLVLKHEDGRYLSWNPDRYPLSPKLSDARRFVSTEEISTFLTSSPYRPEEVGLSASEFEIKEIEIEYREVEDHADSQG
jgi:hypothetical protein